MAITGRFEADFQSYYEACRLAQVTTKGFEGSARDAEKQVNRMVESLNGRRAVQEATAMAEAVAKLGGPARLTEAELRRVGAAADEAVQKMNRWGEAPPRNLQRLADAARSTESGFSSAAGQIHAVDNVLGLLGFHLGPTRKALADLGYAAESGAGGLGRIGTAGLALGAAIGGWQIGRAISEFGGLDEKIGNVAASLLGLPTIAQQAAEATADAIAKAQKAHPELTVLSGETARQLNELDAQAKVAANAHASDVEDRVAAVQRVAEQIKKVNDEIDEVRRSGVYNDLTKQINSQVISLQDLAKQYHLSDEAAQALSRDAARIASVEEANAQKIADLQRQIFLNQVADEQKKAEAAAAAVKARAEQTAADYAATAAQHEKDIALADAQVAARQKVEETNKALRDQADAAKKAQEQIVFSQQYDLSTEEGLAQFKRSNPTASVTGSSDYFKTHSLADAVRDGLVQFYNAAGGRGTPSLGPQSPNPAAAGGGAAGGGFPAPALPAGAAAAAPASAFAGAAKGTTQIYAPVLVSGVFDPSSAHALGATVSRAFFERIANARVLR